MGILVPKGSEVASQLTKKIKEQEFNNIFLDFKERFVLEKGKGNVAKLARVFSDVTRSQMKKELTEQEQKELAEKYSKIADEIIETLGDEQADIATFTFSKGGTRSSLSATQLNDLKGKGANVEYTTVMVKGIIVLEPIGQVDNATYIMDVRDIKDKDALVFGLENIKGVSRNQARELGLMYKINHDISQEERI